MAATGPERSRIVERESAGYAGAGWSMLRSHSVAFEAKISGFYPLEATHATLRSDLACRSAAPGGRWAGGPRGASNEARMRPQRPRRSSAGSRPRRPRASVARLWASKTAQLVVEEVDDVEAPGESQQRRSVDAYCCDWLRNHSFSGHFRAFGLQNSSVVAGPATRTSPRGPPTHTAGTPNFGTAGAASSGRTSPFGRSSGTRPRPRNRVPKIARSTPGVSVYATSMS